MSSGSDEDGDVEMRDDTPNDEEEEGERADVMDEGEDEIDDIFRIFVTTDNHLGYEDTNPSLRDDSFLAFEECLQLAKSHHADCILLGGDLFHHNKPSRETLIRTMKLFRQYCCGSEGVSFRIDNEEPVFAQTNPSGVANFMDPHYNVSLPVFAIHGNHDDPTGQQGLSALDVLSMANLVNYFGKSSHVERIPIRPVLLTKYDRCRVALYGLGHIRDERLYRAFESGKVDIQRPSGARDDYFNIFVLHQNRNRRTAQQKGVITDEMLKFGGFDLVVWGHEHEQLITPESSSRGNFDVIQPGSTIAVQLVPEEGTEKKCCMIEVSPDRAYRCIPYSLQKVRPFACEKIVLDDVEEIHNVRNRADKEVISEFLVGSVNRMIREAVRRRNFDPAVLQAHPALALPLIRLKVDYTGGYATLNPQRFGQKFVDRVANPTNMIAFVRRVARAPNRGGRAGAGAGAAMGDATQQTSSGANIVDFVTATMRETDTDLSVLDPPKFTEAIQSYVEKDEKEAISTFVEDGVKVFQKAFWRASRRGRSKKKMVQEEEMISIFNGIKSDRRGGGTQASLKREGEDGSVVPTDSDDDDMPLPTAPALEDSASPKRRGRGRGRGRRGRGRKKRTLGTTRKKSPPPKKTRSRRAAPKKKKPKRKAPARRRTRKKKPARDEEDGWVPEAEVDDDWAPKSEPEGSDVDDDAIMDGEDFVPEEPPTPIDDPVIILGDDDDDATATAAPAPSGPRRSSRKRKRREIETIDEPPPKRRKTSGRKKKRMTFMRLSDDEDSGPPPPPPSAPAPAPAPAPEATSQPVSSRRWARKKKKRRR